MDWDVDPARNDQFLSHCGLRRVGKWCLLKVLKLDAVGIIATRLPLV
jgi:hypothetical protein